MTIQKKDALIVAMLTVIWTVMLGIEKLMVPSITQAFTQKIVKNIVDVAIGTCISSNMPAVCTTI